MPNPHLAEGAHSFSSSILGAAVLSFSIALLTWDGVFVLVGLAILAVAGAVPVIVL
ncbi:hypothetical protein [Roseovarius sp. D22-M7]|uniref:hypothetical protein n=1 Tax=Roseovarius sp. D22-M7 TaxID=3127116 RepID=UPI00300F899E